MANRWLYAGGDIGMMRNSGTPTSDTTAGRRNATYADHAVSGTTTAGVYADFIDSAGASDAAVTGEVLYARATLYGTGTASVNNFLQIVDGSDQPWIALRNTANGVAGLYYNSNTGASPTWTQIGSSGSASGLAVWVFKVTLGSPHVIELYKDGALFASGNATMASFTSADALRFQGVGATASQCSEFAATVGISLIGSNVYYGKPSAAGSNSGWTGAYTTIDDVGIDDTDLISSGTAAQKSTFAYADLPTLAAGYTIGDLFMWTRAKNDGAAPANVKPVRRDSGSTDNVGSSFSGMGVGFAEFLTRYSGISPAEYNASEFGVESAT